MTPETQEYLAAFRDWSFNRQLPDTGTWIISRANARELFEQVQSLEQERDMYKADRDEYDALLGRKMAERDGFKEQLEATQRDLAREAELRIKDCEDRNAHKRRADLAELKIAAALREAERASDVRVNRTTIIGNIDLILRGESSPAISRIGETTYQWLIERGQPESVSPTVWLENSAEHPPTHRAWTTNARQTAMFPDRESAERYIADEGLDARAVEHGFMNAPDPASEPTPLQKAYGGKVRTVSTDASNQETQPEGE